MQVILAKKRQWNELPEILKIWSNVPWTYGDEKVCSDSSFLASGTYMQNSADHEE